MHCIERTFWWFFCIGVIGDILCKGAPAEEHINEPVNGNSTRHGRESDVEGDQRSTHDVQTVPETATDFSDRLNLDAPNLRLPVHEGPGNYLEARRRQTDSRIQRLETQISELLEAQKQQKDQKPDQEQELRIAIQHGLNCEQGDTVLVCLMKKVVILRREMSGIRRDVSGLGKLVTRIELSLLEAKDTGGGAGKSNKGETKGNEDQDQMADHHGIEDWSEVNETTENPQEAFSHQDPMCPQRFDRVGSVCYYVVTDRTVGVTKARDFCQNHGGYLARPRDSLTIHDLANHLSRIHGTVSELWVDGQYHTKDERWLWNDEKRIDSSIWGISDTPSKTHRSGTCVLLKKELNYLAMPQDCGYHYFFVCEAEATKPTSSPLEISEVA